MARPSAQGQAMTSTAMATSSAREGSPVATHHPTKVSAASTSTTGTKTADTRSARRCTGALVVWARSTSRAMPASVVSAPTRVASTTSRPVVLMLPPVSSSPGVTSTGSDSPVTSEASTALLPSTTRPSVATFSPGRTTNRSPTTSSSTGMRTSVVARVVGSTRSTATSLAPRLSRPRSASRVRSVARASIQRPKSRKVVTTVAVSNQMCAVVTSPASMLDMPAARPVSTTTADHR